MPNTSQINPFEPIMGRYFGIDEAGRGAMAGPLAVAAVEFPWPSVFSVRGAGKLNDSKRMSPKARTDAAQMITAFCRWACVMIDADWIDRWGIQAAECEGLNRVVEELARDTGKAPGEYNWPDLIVCDGTEQTWHSNNFVNRMAGIQGMQMCYMIKGDRYVAAISAASIIAKTMRDEYMKRTAHQQYQEYRFDLHFGYVTSLHLEKLAEFGSCVIHRHTFRPVRERDALNTS